MRRVLSPTELPRQAFRFYNLQEQGSKQNTNCARNCARPQKMLDHLRARALQPRTNIFEAPVTSISVRLRPLDSGTCGDRSLGRKPNCALTRLTSCHALVGRPRVTLARSYNVARTLRRDPISALPPLSRGRALTVAAESQAVIPKRSRPANSGFSVNPSAGQGPISGPTWVRLQRRCPDGRPAARPWA